MKAAAAVLLAQTPRPPRSPEPTPESAVAAAAEGLPDFAITLITIGAIVAGTYLLTRLIRRGITRALERRVPEATTLADKRAQTMGAVLQAAVTAVLWTVAALLVLSEAGINIGPLIAAAGIGGVALGFGAQNLVRDVIAGFFVLFEDQYHVGDVVRIAGVAGRVEKVTLRTTVLRDLNGEAHTVPNGEIAVTTNLTKDFSRYVVDLPVPYDQDVDHVVAMVREVAEELRRDPAYAGSMLGPLEVLGVDSYGESQVVVKVYLETIPGKQWEVGREFRRRVKRSYDEHGISVPYPHREVILRTGEAAQTPPQAEQATTGDAER